jgi:YidC/Oxa1 family membrane protein insertase
MNPLTTAWNALSGFLEDSLIALHNILEPVFGVEEAWGWAIIALTLIVRILLLPLAIRQTRSMKGMQAIQPKVKEIQARYKVDRELMRKDPERYQKLKAKQNEELMALYKEEGVNPAASCLPLILQMPIFFALFRILGVNGLEALRDAHFYFITDFIDSSSEAIGLGASVSASGWPGYMLIVLMAASMFITQRQMMARNSAEGPAATQQKIMMYVFPVFLAFISFNFPLAVVLYWVTTNIWQGVQQWIMFRVTSDDEEAGGQKPATRKPSSGDGGENGAEPTSRGKKKSDPAGGSKNGAPAPRSGSQGKKPGHLPKRKGN